MNPSLRSPNLMVLLDIYADKLLEQDPKRALQEIEKLIKKHGSSPPFSACKAIALHRLDSFGRDVRVGKTCLDLIDGIPVNAESDDFTVQCVIHYYQHETADCKLSCSSLPFRSTEREY